MKNPRFHGLILAVGILADCRKALPFVFEEGSVVYIQWILLKKGGMLEVFFAHPIINKMNSANNSTRIF